MVLVLLGFSTLPHLCLQGQFFIVVAVLGSWCLFYMFLVLLWSMNILLDPVYISFALNIFVILGHLLDQFFLEAFPLDSASFSEEVGLNGWWG